MAEWSLAAGAGPGKQQAWQEFSWHKKLIVYFQTSKMRTLGPEVIGKNLPVLFFSIAAITAALWPDKWAFKQRVVSISIRCVTICSCS